MKEGRVGRSPESLADMSRKLKVFGREPTPCCHVKGKFGVREDVKSGRRGEARAPKPAAYGRELPELVCPTTQKDRGAGAGTVRADGEAAPPGGAGVVKGRAVSPELGGVRGDGGQEVGNHLRGGGRL